MTPPADGEKKQCILWFHDWTMWGELIEQTWVSHGPIAFPHEERKHIRFIQEKTCNRCGQKERRFVQ